MSADIAQTTASAVAPAVAMVPAGQGAGPDHRGRPLRRVRHLASVAVAVIGLLAVGVLVWLAVVVNDHNQLRLLRLQVDQAGVVLGEVVPSIRTPLTTTVAVADTSGGNASKVTEYVGDEVGSSRQDRFRSLSLWELPAGGSARRLLTLGSPSSPGSSQPGIAAFLAHVQPGQLAVASGLGATHPSLGFGVVSIGAAPRYAVYAELPVPASRKAAVPSTSAFKDLNFALYLGRSASASRLIEATTRLPLPSPTARTAIPFGTTYLDFVGSPTGSLGGDLLPALPWIIGVVGVVLTAAGASLAGRLTRRRRLAEELAAENHQLFAQQRSIAQSLQTALLPQELPEVEGVEVSVRYVPGDPVADIGGDWYDIIRCDADSFLFVIGDVSGRGLPAAKAMASLHYAIRAYAADGDDPATILAKLGGLLDVSRDGHFATVLVGHVHAGRHELTVANAGHLPPLVVANGESHFADTPAEAPIGVKPGSAYTPVTVMVPPRASVVAYTDGLVERRGEMLDVGLERLRKVAAGQGDRHDGLIDAVVRDLTADAATDDVALMELRWMN